MGLGKLPLMDLTATYQSLETRWLLDRYIPAERCARDGLKLRHSLFYGRENEDLSDDARMLAQSLAEDNSSNRLLVYLSRRSPLGLKDSSGMLGSHAVALCIDHAKRTIDYQDPHGFQMEAPLRNSLTDILHGYDVTDHCIKQQQDLTSCAPITIRNLMAFAEGKAPDANIDIAAVRAQDALALKERPAPSVEPAKTGPKPFFKIK